MLADQLQARLDAFPWLPEDYVRILAKVQWRSGLERVLPKAPGGIRRYGFEWFTGPHCLTQLAAGWELIFNRDGDSWLCVRKEAGSYELLEAQHGSIGAWQATTPEAAFAALLALAPSNDGATMYAFGRLSVPKPT